MEIPRSIKFDFLLVIVGLASSYAPTYFGFNEINIVFSIFVTIVGFYVFIQGITLIGEDYDIDRTLKKLESAKQINEYIKYFEKERIISKKNKDELLKDVRNHLKQN